MQKPTVVTREEWQQARDELLVAEKEATRAQDALAARRRRLPMVKLDGDYTFDTPHGPKSLAELFDGRDQLLVYQFMDNGPDDFCPGCTWFTNGVPAKAPEQLAERGVTWRTVSNMPLAQIEGYWKQQGWTLPYASSRGTTFSDDIGAGRYFALASLLRDGDDVYLTYNTMGRGV